MRLINTNNGAFEEFQGRNIPEYSILSHTWGDDEVLYRDMFDPSCVHKKGYHKIQMTCKIAAEAGIQYAWVDTCNIDKSSSAELTEAINSMFLWYKRSKICYVILEDLPASASIQSMKNCRWFSRGWTLQELIAPRNISFFDQDWNFRGSKTGLANQLSEITRIDTEVLLHQRSLSTVAVAQRMSWASQRETTRIEDTAYSLVGIFNVNMPLLYGEESKAFRRLQEEIIRTTPDLSIFGWSLPTAPRVANMRVRQGRSVCGVLAHSPAAYLSCSSMTKNKDHTPIEFAVTNVGIKSRIPITVIEYTEGTRRTQDRVAFVLLLRCSNASRTSLGVKLRKCGLNQFVREDPWKLVECTKDLFPIRSVERYFLTNLPDAETESVAIMDMNLFIPQRRSHALQIVYDPGVMEIRDVANDGRYDFEDEVFFVSGDTSWDSSLMHLAVRIPGQRSAANLLCAFYAVNWSSFRHGQFQYSLVDDENIAKSLDEIQSELLQWDHQTSALMSHLLAYEIPRTSSIAIKRPGMKRTALISAEATIEEDSDICSSKFWRVSFSIKLLKDEDVPRIRQRSWNQPSYEEKE